MVKMMKVDDENYVPEECCTFTNPLTSASNKSEIDDVDMPCGADCSNDCGTCIIQKILNEYAELTEQRRQKLSL